MKFMQIVFTGIAASAMLSSPVFAQTPDTIPGHPRVNEVDQRIENQQNRTERGVEQGTITGKQAVRDEHRDERIQNQATRMEAKNGGHLTKHQTRRLNRELNHNSKHIKNQRAE